jgi:hypothetical protein
MDYSSKSLLSSIHFPIRVVANVIIQHPTIGVMWQERSSWPASRRSGRQSPAASRRSAGRSGKAEKGTMVVRGSLG